MKGVERKRIDDALMTVLEDLASIEHERWSSWQTHMHDKGVRQSDGSLLIPRESVERWDRQIATTYADLSEREKEADRDQVRKYLPLISETIAKLEHETRFRSV